MKKETIEQHNLLNKHKHTGWNKKTREQDDFPYRRKAHKVNRNTIGNSTTFQTDKLEQEQGNFQTEL